MKLYLFLLNVCIYCLLQLKQVGSSTVPASADQTQEVGRLRGDLEKKTHMYEEELARRETQHNTDLKALRKELRDAESQHLALQKEILMLKDKLDKTRRERYDRQLRLFIGTELSLIYTWTVRPSPHVRGYF